MTGKIAWALPKKKGRAWKLREIKARRMRERIREYRREVRIFKPLGFRHERGRWVIDAGEIFGD